MVCVSGFSSTLYTTCISADGVAGTNTSQTVMNGTAEVPIAWAADFTIHLLQNQHCYFTHIRRGMWWHASLVHPCQL